MGGWACLVSSQSPLLSPSNYLKEPQVFFNYFPHSMDGMILLFCIFFYYNYDHIINNLQIVGTCVDLEWIQASD